MTQDAHLEIEVKILAPDLDAIRARLEAADDARCVRPRVHEYNIRYESEAGDLAPAGVVLRLRRERPVGGGADRVRLTYKAPAEQTAVGALTRFEAEVEVSDFETTDLIVQRLGYHPHMIYEKYRTTYELAGAEVVLDEMPYGNFIEVEGTLSQINHALALLGLADAHRIRASYVDLFERVRAAQGLDFRDLTFANFAAIAVPSHLFGPGVEP